MSHSHRYMIVGLIVIRQMLTIGEGYYISVDFSRCSLLSTTGSPLNILNIANEVSEFMYLVTGYCVDTLPRLRNRVSSRVLG